MVRMGTITSKLTTTPTMVVNSDSSAVATDPRRCSTRARERYDYDDAAEAKEMIASKKIKLSIIPPQLLNIDNLPDSVLLNITCYLQETSRVLLAVALTTTSSFAKPSVASNIIISADRWDNRNKNFRTTVDFVDTDKILAARLSDEDICGVLKCVGAVHEINTVKLTHCVGITGSGLEALKGLSTTLEQVDLSLVAGNKNPKLSPEPAISEAKVLPILESIIDADSRSGSDADSIFKKLYVEFPKKWRDEKSELMVKFLSKYNRVMNDRKISCAYDCGTVCEGTQERPWVNTTGTDFGMHNFTCYECKYSHCSDCTEDNYFPDKECEKCEKKYCFECNMIMQCDTCQETTCRECSFIGTCDTCDKSTCGNCCHVFYCECCGNIRCMDCIAHNFCDHSTCNMSNCVECENDDHDCVKHCFDCGETYCPEHLLKDHIQYGEDCFCQGCNDRATTHLSSCNESLEKWVKELEDRYGINHISRSHVVEDFSDAMQARELLRQRCHSVGNVLSFKQKKFERFDFWYKRYDSDLTH